MRPDQFSLFPKERSRREHGGEVGKGRRKLARPIDTKRPMHVVLKSTRAKGKWSFLRGENKGLIHLLLLDTCERYGVKLIRFENVGNHLHLIIQGKSRRLLRAFMRVFPQRVMFAVTGARKGNPVGRFFDEILYSRIVSWGRELRILRTYLWKNAMEALGLGRPNKFTPIWVDS